MKKKLLFLFFVFIFYTKAFSQVYVPFPNEGIWYQESILQDSPFNRRALNSFFYINGDTSIQGKIYHKLYENRSQGAYVAYKGALRATANKEVFYRAKTDTIENLLYKFGLSVGDSLNFPLRRINKIVKVLAVDSISIGGVFRKRYSLDTQHLGDNNKDYWIEGIGSTKGLFYSYSGDEFENTETLLCFENKSGVIYKARINEGCFLSSIGNEFNTQNNIKLYPNPFLESVTLESPLSISGDFELFDITGKQLRKEAFEGTTFEFHRKGLTAGVYIFKILEKGRPLSIGKLIVQ
jgi:Secretion system C-terminal sorting domain